jgi:hypothetical protein
MLSTWLSVRIANPFSSVLTEFLLLEVVLQPANNNTNKTIDANLMFFIYRKLWIKVSIFLLKLSLFNKTRANIRIIIAFISV